MTQIWTGRVAQAAGKYGENAPMAAVCCNACRTCVTTNVIGIVTVGIAGAGSAVAGFTRRRFAKPWYQVPVPSRGRTGWNWLRWRVEPARCLDRLELLERLPAAAAVAERATRCGAEDVLEPRVRRAAVRAAVHIALQLEEGRRALRAGCRRGEAGSA